MRATREKVATVEANISEKSVFGKECRGMEEREREESLRKDGADEKERSAGWPTLYGRTTRDRSQARF